MFKRTVLPNGLRLILVPEKDAVTATVFVMVEAGSEYESKQNNGISHFLEHLVFKGTTNRPEPGRVIREIDGLGADYNAYTSREHTAYYAKVQADKVEKALEIISDIHLNPIFDLNEIERERGAVIEEINMYKDLPMRGVHDTLLELMYGDQPAGWNIAGPKINIKKLQRKDVVAYRNKHYVASKTAVVVSGKFNEKKIIEIVKKNFGKLPKVAKIKKSKTKDKQAKPQVKIEKKTLDQSHLALSIKAFPIHDDRRHALQVLASYLGGGMSSKLFILIREELGAAYYVRSSADLYLDHGHLEVSAGVDHKKLETVIGAVIGEFKELVEKPISAEDLKRTKDNITGRMMVGLDTSEDLAAFYGTQEIDNRKIATPEEAVQRIERVTAADIQSVAKDIFKDRNLNLVVIGPLENTASLKKVLHF